MVPFGGLPEPIEPSTPKPHFGPYVSVDGGALEATLLVKAAPELTKSHGVTVCTAAFLDDGRFVRLYPVKWVEFGRRRASRYSRVRVHVEPSDEAARRPESHRIRGGLEVIGGDLVTKRGSAPWSKRMAILGQNIEPDGVAGLRAKQAAWRTSLGLVKVKELRDFHIDGDPDDIIRAADLRQSPQLNLFGMPSGTEGSPIDRIDHVFRYDWCCDGPCCRGGGHHTMQCEDWEIFESFRQWRKRYPDKDQLAWALWNKYYDEMGMKDLHFVLGTTSDPKFQQSPTIIGIVYPPTDDANRRPLVPRLGAFDTFRPAVAKRRKGNVARAAGQATLDA